MLDSDIHIDSICLKDASGTTDPKTIYDTAIGMKKIMPPEMPLWLHTHDTASMAVACYMAGIDGGADGVDLRFARWPAAPFSLMCVRWPMPSKAPAMSSMSMSPRKCRLSKNMLNESLKRYAFNPTTTTADARVLGFPMPGGAIGPNVHMMVKAGILDKYSDVLAEFPVVVEAGGAWTSVTPGSQQYWLQAFNNVLYGRWKKIDAGYGRAVLGISAKLRCLPIPKSSKIASEQLGPAGLRRRSAGSRTQKYRPAAKPSKNEPGS